MALTRCRAPNCEVVWYARACMDGHPGATPRPLSIGAQPDAASATAPTARNPPILRIRPSSVLVSSRRARARPERTRDPPGILHLPCRAGEDLVTVAGRGGGGAPPEPPLFPPPTRRPPPAPLFPPSPPPPP